MLHLFGVLAEGETTTAGTLATGIADFMSVVSSVITAIAANPILMACLCAGLIFIATRFVKRLAH